MPNKLVYERNPAVVEDTVRRALVDASFKEIMEQGVHYLEEWLKSPDDIREAVEKYKDSNRKGKLGNLIEEFYFGYQANSRQEADLEASGIEVKVTPFEKRSSGNMVAGERLVITMINYSEAVEEDFYNSHIWKKIEKTLLIYYLRQKEKANELLYRIRYVKLFTPPDKDMAIIIADYSYLTKKIKEGEAHLLSEADTNYLGACTKGATAESSWVEQTFYYPGMYAKKRAFCFKNSYMTYVLNEYVLNRKLDVESIIIDSGVLKNTTFDDYVQSLISSNIGKTDKELCKEYGLEYTNNKAQWSTLAFRMLGVKTNSAEEFVKAGITVKSIRIEENGQINEHMSLPPIRLKDVGIEDWEESSIYEYFDEKKFLFVVYKKDGDCYRLLGAKLWHMPFEDLITDVRNGWLATKRIVNNGIVFDITLRKNGEVVVKNNLPGSSENRIIHVRPHAKKRYYKLENGETIGDGTPAMAEELPDGRWMPKQSFWLNNSYIKEVINDILEG